jgi:hypothetical protein
MHNVSSDVPTRQPSARDEAGLTPEAVVTAAESVYSPAPNPEKWDLGSGSLTVKLLVPYQFAFRKSGSPGRRKTATHTVIDFPSDTRL